LIGRPGRHGTDEIAQPRRIAARDGGEMDEQPGSYERVIGGPVRA
jgi:hypothetical protein